MDEDIQSQGEAQAGGQKGRIRYEKKSSIFIFHFVD